MKQTLKEADYSYVKSIGNGQHILKDNKTKNKELFFVNKNHANWGIKFKNTHLEYGRHLHTKDLVELNLYNS